MTLSLKSHLKRQTLWLFGIAYGTSLLILIISSIFQTLKSQENALIKLAATAGTQVNTILPSFLLPEEKTGQSLLLNKFRKEEGLSHAEIIGFEDESVPSEWKNSCNATGELLTCHRFFPSQVAIIVPINHGDIHFGRLLKVQDIDGGLLAKSYIPSAIILAFALLVSLLGLVWGVMRLTTKEIPAATELLLDTVKRCLEGEVNSRQNDFRFDEFKRLSDSIDSLICTTQDGRRMSAIAQTTQMLAHDVRKPFTMIQGILDMMADCSPEDAKKIAEENIPEVNQAIRSVNGMIADVMEIGSGSTINQEPANLESLVVNVLNENLRFIENATVEISYELCHSHQVFIDTLKVERVLSNIIGNGLQAMKHNGRLWIGSSEKDGMITVTLGNSGSYIPPEDIKNLFEMFFTKGKKGGTGLGLAIAKKVVSAHGGSIWCTSDQEKGTEFHFTLPTSEELKRFDGVLPFSAKEIRSRFESINSNKASDNISESKSLTHLVQSITKEVKGSMKVLICDDESVYRNLIESHIASEDAIHEKVKVITVNKGSDALEIAQQENPDVIVMDVDLGKDEDNGFEVVRRLRKEGSKAKICIHSNRGAMEYQKDAVAAGADLFMPKPMTKSHLLSIILGSIPSHNESVEEATTNNGHYVVVDDSKIMLFSWQRFQNQLGSVKGFQSPEDFWEATEKDSEFLKQTKAVVTDQHFGDFSKINGLDFAADLRRNGFSNPIYLASSGDFSDDELASSMVKKIPKAAKEAIHHILT